MSWAGIDVGGRRKGFHGAAVDGTKVIKGFHRLGGVDEVMRWLFAIEPEVVALDSPKTCARRGERSRECERELMKVDLRNPVDARGASRHGARGLAFSSYQPG